MAKNPFDPKRFGILGGLMKAAPPPPKGALSDLLSSSLPPSKPQNALAVASDLPSRAPLKPAIKRRAFFSFHYDDIMRVNVVRNAWKLDHPDNALMRSFQDSSLWERRKLEGDDAVKRLIREGVEYTSAVCVLIGSDTRSRRWVRYEIARAIVDRRDKAAQSAGALRRLSCAQRGCPRDNAQP